MSSVFELVTERLLITYFESANLHCSERYSMPAYVYVLIVFVCTGTPLDNVVASLSMYCNFFRSVIRAEQYTS